jgi:hypothetical protein
LQSLYRDFDFFGRGHGIDCRGFALIDIDACALLRLRFAMVADVVELLAQARESLAIN